MEMNEGLESPTYKEVQRAGSIQAAEEKVQEDLINVYKYLEGACEEDRSSVWEQNPRLRTTKYLDSMAPSCESTDY